MAAAKPKAENPVGKIYRVSDAQAFLRHGSLLLCLEHRYQKHYRWAPLRCTDEGLDLYEERHWYTAALTGVPTRWQPTSAQFHQLWGGMTLAGEQGRAHPLLGELLTYTPVPLAIRPAQGGA
jgi:hypothetical protein